ncbi:MAG: carbon storage regulator CsrA [Clostridiales bacterium]|jgi:carbon storage regulator|nr:carbon storage regulator CsrA [Eubacteriales bacterium]MDH7566167.1 carbon storage regulator CsrA [Clostridiales bacterium]
MLVLTRKKEQSIIINDNIEVTIIDIQGDQVRIGISAPKSVSVHRKEIFLEIQEENRKASEVKVVPLDGLLKGKDEK